MKIWDRPGEGGRTRGIYKNTDEISPCWVMESMLSAQKDEVRDRIESWGWVEVRPCRIARSLTKRQKSSWKVPFFVEKERVSWCASYSQSWVRPRLADRSRFRWLLAEPPKPDRCPRSPSKPLALWASRATPMGANFLSGPEAPLSYCERSRALVAVREPPYGPLFTTGSTRGLTAPRRPKAIRALTGPHSETVLSGPPAPPYHREVSPALTGERERPLPIKPLHPL